MRWTSRLRRRGGAAAIAETRARQMQLLNRAKKRVDLAKPADDNLGWLLEHPLRTLNADEEAFYQEAIGE